MPGWIKTQGHKDSYCMFVWRLRLQGTWLLYTSISKRRSSSKTTCAVVKRNWTSLSLVLEILLQRKRNSFHCNSISLAAAYRRRCPKVQIYKHTTNSPHCISCLEEKGGQITHITSHKSNENTGRGPNTRRNQRGKDIDTRNGISQVVDRWD